MEEDDWLFEDLEEDLDDIILEEEPIPIKCWVCNDPLKKKHKTIKVLWYVSPKKPTTVGVCSQCEFIFKTLLREAKSRS